MKGIINEATDILDKIQTAAQIANLEIRCRIAEADNGRP